MSASGEFFPRLRPHPRIFSSFVASGVIIFAGLMARLATTSDGAIMVGEHLQLFVDAANIDQKDKVSLLLQSPRPAEVSLRFDAPWEGADTHYVVVFKDGSIFRMYYRSVAGRHTSATGVGWVNFICYAESKDGITWRRPDLGLFEFEGSRHNNIIWPDTLNPRYDNGALLFPWRNQRPGATAAWRYLAPGVRERQTAHGWTSQLFLFSSADAIHWRQGAAEPILDRASSTFYPSPALLGADVSLFWEPRLQRYVLYVGDQWPASGSGQPVRGVRRSTSADLAHWSYPAWIHLHPQPPDSFYSSGISPYYREPTLYFAFPMRYLAGRTAPMPAEFDAQRGVGVSDSVFMSSRDGRDWDRTFLETFLRPGLDPLKWTDRSNNLGRGPVPTGPAEMSLYALEYFRLPFPQVRRYTLRVDGVASAHAGYAGGSLVTQPMIFSGRRLIINAATSAAGSIRVEILTERNEPIDRYAGCNALEFFGDAIDHEVRWDQGPDLGSLAGLPIRLKFLIKDADLFSFHFSQ